MQQRFGNVYPGIDADLYGGMTDIGRIIRDAWVFGLLAESETCAGWNYGRIEQLYDHVHAEWERYDHLVSRLPPELRERHERIHAEAVRRARAAGWSAEPGEDD
jgi:hypothetical protein